MNYDVSKSNSFFVLTTKEWKIDKDRKAEGVRELI